MCSFSEVIIGSKWPQHVQIHPTHFSHISIIEIEQYIIIQVTIFYVFRYIFYTFISETSQIIIVDIRPCEVYTFVCLISMCSFAQVEIWEK